MSTQTVSDTRYQAIRRRDPQAEGRFFYAVRTTGVYCRPTCAARLPRPENVEFHATAEAAERAGFRPCKRCQPRAAAPGDRQAERVRAARTQIEARIADGDTAPALAQLARDAGSSPFHFHRLFKRHTGLTPRQYAAAVRLGRFGQAVRGGATVTGAIYQAGYSSSSRFYEQATGTLGMKPTELRRGGAGLVVRATVRPCALGLMLVAATPRGVCSVAFGERAAALQADLRRRFPRAAIAPGDQALEDLADRVAALVDIDTNLGTVATDLPLDLIGTAFQQKVWRALREIPAGTTTTYAALAAKIGSPRAVRAVGTACGANPVAVAVPCHRVLRGDGGLGGYRWGLARKRALLDRERGR
jgi:AraC family transcriptional regulator of adaptative response/methylated-DNA-[protein]-cysteine methyltransferase